MKLTDYLHESTIFYLATVENNKPKIRPIGGKPNFEGDGFVELEGKIYFYTDNSKEMFRQMKNQPEIGMTFTVSTGFVRIYGTAVFDGNKDAKQAILDENPILKSVYSAEDNLFEVFYLDNFEAYLYSPMQKPQKLV